jgi:long-chain acyl-CoA synthetase
MPNITTFLDTDALNPAVPALIHPGTGAVVSYPDLVSRVSCIGKGLQEAGIGMGDRVCIYLDSSPEYLISYFAIWRIGAVAVPANIVYKEGELLHALNDSGCSALICSSASEEIIGRVKGRVPGLTCIIMTGDAPPGYHSWNALLEKKPAYMRPVWCDFNHPCQLQYTAGTTGRPKGAVLSHGNWIAALEAEREVLSFVKGDVYLGIYPMGHVGVSWGISALRAGGTFVIMERFSEEEYLKYCRDYRVTVLAGMPPVIHRLTDAPPGTEEYLKTVRVIISGGGQLLPAIWEEFDRRYAIPVANSYGLSETIVVGSGTATLPGFPDLTRNYRSVGVPVGYTEVRIVDPDDPDHELAAGETGEIALRGPSVACGYWNLPDETREVFRDDGWFLTGDIGYLDEGGVLSITDRKKDMIIMSGWKVYPTEVENILMQHEEIADVAVFGQHDTVKGEIPVAAVVLKPGGHLSVDEMESFCRSRMAGYKVPRRMVLVDELPRAHGWKLLRRSLREKFGEVS